ncbi:hypothetical protein Taro_040702 [Colocasia esculenta]|uniref:3-hydroxyisobutyryl-CoA hydrolase n=1 Tax=Colocasia esculenta TaxID=4460 RepID=A0A843WDV9_COLES|nr:hypothetical protein [Colocasia esculenta]
MAQEPTNPEQVVLVEEVKHVRLLILNRPRQLNVLSSKVVALLAESLEKWDKDDSAELVIVKGAGRAFSAGGDLKMFYEGRSGNVMRVALVHGLVMGGGGALIVPANFSVVTEKTVFAVPEASIGHHTDCSFSYILSRLSGHLGEFLALTGARLNGKEMIAAGLATHFVPSEKLLELEERLLNLDTGNESKVRMAIQEFAIDVQPEEESVLNKLSVINKCFSKETIEEIISSFEAEARIEGNGWIGTLLKGLRRSSPTGLKITLRSVREGREQTLAECLKKEFRLTMNILRSVISGDVYEGIRSVTIDKDNAPKWNPETLKEVSYENLDIVFKPFKDELELTVPSEGDAFRWTGKYEVSVYPKLHSNNHNVAST